MEVKDTRIRDVLALGRPNRATDRATEAIALGLRFADDTGDTRFDSRHLLSGLFREPEGVAHFALQNLNVTQHQIDGAVRSAARSRNPSFTIDDDIKTVLSGAFAAADEMSHSYIGTEHLLIGAVADGTKSAEFLASVGLARSVVTKEVHDILGHGLGLPWSLLAWATATLCRIVSFLRHCVRRDR